MLDFFFKTSNDWSPFILRITASLIMLPHGLQKLAGLFGGYGFNATMSYLTGTVKLPWLIALGVILIESIGAIGLLLGVCSRLWAVAFIVIMVGAIATTNWRHGLFMNWFGNQGGEGFEYHLLFIGICTALVITGGGKYAVDGLIR